MHIMYTWMFQKKMTSNNNFKLYIFFQFQDFRFLCPNDTVFDQQNLVCTNWFEVDCKQSIHFFAQEIGLKEPGANVINILL